MHADEGSAFSGHLNEDSCDPGLGDRLVRKNSSKIGRWACELRIKPPKVLDCVSPHLEDIYKKLVSPNSI